MNLYVAFFLSWLVIKLCLIPKLTAKHSVANNETSSDISGTIKSNDSVKDINRETFSDRKSSIRFNDSVVEKVREWKTFSDNDGKIKFNHLVVDKERGWVFIGGDHRIYKLNPNLTVNESIYGNEKCHNGVCQSNILNNPNKILALDYESSRLISCHSHQILCAIYKIEDMSVKKKDPLFEAVTVSSPDASTVAFVAPGPSTQISDEKKTSVLYVGVTYAKDTVVPAVATRSLEEGKSFKIVQPGSDFGNNDGTRIKIHNIYRENYIVNYVYGFSSGSYSYFLTTQREAVDSSQYISKLIRICQKEENYNSYTEIPIKCTDRNGKNYNSVQAAYVAKPNSDLAKSLGIDPQDNVLFGVFAQSEHLQDSESNKPSNESALCVYSLKTINEKFTENIRSCSDGKGDRGIEYIIGRKESCMKNSGKKQNSCGVTYDTPFSGNLPTQATAVITFHTLLTAVTAVSKSDFALVIVGTCTGHLQLIALTSTAVLKFSDIVLKEDSPVNSDLLFDSNEEYLYAMTTHKLTRIKISDYLPSIFDVKPDKGPREGGTNVTIAIENFGYLLINNNLEIKLVGISCSRYELNFNLLKEIVCITNTSSNTSKVQEGSVEIFINGTRVVNDKKFAYVDPKITKVSRNDLALNGTELKIEGEHLIAGNTIEIFIGNESCSIFNSTFNNISESDVINCRTNISSDCLDGNITLKIDGSVRTYGTPFSELKKPANGTKDYIPFWKNSIYGIPILYLCCAVLVGFVALIFIIFALCCIHRVKQSATTRKMRDRMNKLELCVAAECKEAFAELQIEMTNLSAENLIDGLPFYSYRAYVMKILFPEMKMNCLFLNEGSLSFKRPNRLNLLDSLIKNKLFLLTFIRTLENDENFSMKSRVYIASVLMISLHNNMDYGTDILETLLADLITKYTQGKGHPKLLLRGTESVVEKMLSIWFTFLLYNFLRQCAGEPLFKLFAAMKQHINKGPVDMITSEARYSLNQEKLIRGHIDFRPLTVHVNISQQTAMHLGIKSAKDIVSLTVLDCDAITQVKEKAVDIIFRALGYSRSPDITKLDLKWMTGALEGKILHDYDSSSKTDGEWRQKNTLRHYKVPDGAKLTLILIKRYDSSFSPADKTLKKAQDINASLLRTRCTKQQVSESECALIRDHESYFREWHLIKPYNSDNGRKKCDDSYKMVSEIYLNRVLATKVTLQRYVDDLFQTLLAKPNQNHCFPTAIKYMFDFLDDQAAQRGITDPEVVHTWKNNCLPLRFWVNLIKNPNFLFDVYKSNIVDSCLSVVAQAFMDSCSTADHHLGKDSPTSKLLYARDIPTYKKWVKKYYADIKALPPVSRQHAKIAFAKELLHHSKDFDTNASIFELYKYMKIHRNELTTALKENKISQRFLLADKFEELMNAMEADYNNS